MHAAVNGRDGLGTTNVNSFRTIRSPPQCAPCAYSGKPCGNDRSTSSVQPIRYSAGTDTKYLTPRYRLEARGHFTSWSCRNHLKIQDKINLLRHFSLSTGLSSLPRDSLMFIFEAPTGLFTVSKALVQGRPHSTTSATFVLKKGAVTNLALPSTKKKETIALRSVTTAEMIAPWEVNEN